jgi:pyruvate/2-oxoglutarate dehydrogenase complex dihydrolipoamide acyltransferase (E2) component
MSMHEGTIVSWLKDPGDPVVEGEPIAEVETDKTTMEVLAPASGVLARIDVDPGTTVAVHTRIALIE